MTRPARTLARGFTLMEIILVMIVGASLLFAGTMLYNTLRENAGAASARARTSALHMLVEKLVSEEPTGALPSAAQLADAWRGARQDWESSPWGGKSICKANPASVPAAAPKGACFPDDTKPVFRELQVCETGTNTRCFDSAKIVDDSGLLVYLHYTPATLARRRFPYVSAYDHSQKAYVRTSRFAVAAQSADGKEFFFVSGPAYVDPTTGQPASASMLPGSPGTSCDCSPYDTEGQIGSGL